jgi:hypothetical protein
LKLLQALGICSLKTAVIELQDQSETDEEKHPWQVIRRSFPSFPSFREEKSLQNPQPKVP